MGWGEATDEPAREDARPTGITRGTASSPLFVGSLAFCADELQRNLAVRPFRLRGEPKRFFGATAVRPQQATHGWTLGIAPTPPGSRRFCARGRAHSAWLRSQEHRHRLRQAGPNPAPFTKWNRLC
jgi:hypothetical protein